MSDSWPRRRLLAILRGASEPLDAQELARITGQHVTTVRFHLDVLTRESLVRQFQQPPRGRGRPRIGYSAVQRSVGYQDLAQVLADQLGPDPRRRAEAANAAGRAWGSRLDVGDHRVESLDDAKDLTMTLMSELGFAPERDPSPENEGKVLIRLTACPLRELARTHSDVVCGVHQGLLEDVLRRGGAQGTVDVRMHPFVEPELCVARLELVAAQRAEAQEPAKAPPGGDAEALTTPSGRMAPQLRNADPNIAKQSAQQW
ncbi:helix-turn-helix transcriptional regulator [Nocardia beijingensis]|uniref:helix-turn-helix transcriptional regulator n=1 Tax=Nocardia beijingensis TaxID=95162 RepID=UPI0008302718|nr:transcriptional regulator [Nocardia beijingensis]MBF6077198.1 transcriptional regulator [Nocardia beijingensis]